MISIYIKRISLYHACLSEPKHIMSEYCHSEPIFHFNNLVKKKSIQIVSGSSSTPTSNFIRRPPTIDKMIRRKVVAWPFEYVLFSQAQKYLLILSANFLLLISLILRVLKCLFVWRLRLSNIYSNPKMSILNLTLKVCVVCFSQCSSSLKLFHFFSIGSFLTNF